ncbi:hypothetical protein LEN26_002748 [Aphanomyces euteiches]|nr:hypothetical protein AeMF1_019196 [Aphanomyces euteiches]KAH9158748.1 hypothetical protein LEN26_002748 [Aphanomyces euteiches]KAH9196646.1 hypothetical protein AeNC1_001371 [Aphanomyces euteiches]
MMDIFWFNIVTCGLLLALTILFSLLPLFITQQSTQTMWNTILKEKLPFLTAGVFLSTGMIHLLPDAVKLYNSYLDMIGGPEEPFPFVYFLASLGCFFVWCVDSLNFGNSGEVMVVAAAAKPNYETSICRIQVPPIKSFGIPRRSRTFSASDALHPNKNEELSFQYNFVNSSIRQGFVDYGTCSCDHTMLSTSGLIKLTKEHTEADVLLAGNKCAVNVERKDQCVSDPHVHAHVTGSVSEHIVFSGESTVLPYLLAALFSVHSLIAGFSLGINSELSSAALATALAIVTHKFVEAVSVGANFAKAKSSVAPLRSIAVLVTYSFMTPLGIVAGMCLNSTLQGASSKLAQAVALGIGAGSFIYLAFHEVSEKDEKHETPIFEKISLFLVGVSVMTILAVYV